MWKPGFLKSGHIYSCLHVQMYNIIIHVYKNWLNNYTELNVVATAYQGNWPLLEIVY